MSSIKVLQGDLTRVDADAIVNAANSSLMGGGGVDGAIHRAGGPTILEECKKIVERQGRLPSGEAVITTGGNLPSRHVIHTVGPVWHGGKKNEDEKLRNCYINSLKVALENDCKTVAFPNISTGVYHFPKPRAAQIAVQAVKDYLSNNKGITEVTFVCFDKENYKLTKAEIEKP